MKQVTARVIDNRQILPGMARPHARNISGVQLLWLSCPDIAQEARPGQFVMVRCGGDCLLPRPFSIHQVNKEGIALLFNVWQGGKGTRWLAGLKANENVELFGPLGNTYTILPGSRNLLLVAGGMGVAPLYFLAQEALKQGCHVTLLYGTPDARRLREEFLPARIELVSATEDGAVGRKGKVTELLPEFVSQADQVFACGPIPMYRDMVGKYHKLLKNKSVQVSLEVRMGCGLGVCYGCTIKTKTGLKQVCKDGPVFELQDILWDELKS